MLIIFGVIFAIIIAVGAVVLGHVEPNNAKVGDCLQGQRTFQRVSCQDSRAAWKVVGRVDLANNPNATLSTACSQYRASTVSYQQATAGGTGFILCLMPLK
jgi:hypothetical protein